MNIKNYQPSDFRRQLRQQMYQHRALEEHGDSRARVAPMYPHWAQGIFPPLQSAAERALPAALRHKYLAALDSSQAFALNLLLPFRPTPDSGGSWAFEARALEQVLRSRLSSCFHIKDLLFEFVGPPHVLAETHESDPTPPPISRAAHSDKEYETQVDCAVWVQDEQGRNGLVLIEVKLAEAGFSTCNGLTSPGNRRKDVCGSASTMFANPSHCYLTHPYRATRDRRYWTIFEKQYGSLAKAFPSVKDGPCPFAGHFQQPMRNHALALGLVQSGFCDFAHFGLLYHDHNPDVPTYWQQYCAGVADPGMLFSIKASELIDRAPHSGGWQTWAHYMRKRYALSQDN